MQMEDGIAIIGMSCKYPGARCNREFWENILAKRQAFREFPDCRLPLSSYHDPDHDAPDKTYCKRAALIDGFEFNAKKWKIAHSTLETTDISHWLALDVAVDAIKDSGISLSSNVLSSSAVYVGNTLTGEQIRSSGIRLRWPYLDRVLRDASKAIDLPTSWENALASTFESFLKSSIGPAINEDSLAGSLSNTIAGRICNQLDLRGGGYTIDGACCSSLLAIATAMREIMNGSINVAIAGGVDISLDPLELVGFAKAGALSSTGKMCVYDKKGNGFLPGEGCGFVVLKRLDQAIRDNDRIYAVAKGWGISSDGKGAITAPKAEGQAFAIRKAYEMAGYPISSLSFIEGHGTGTVVGDVVEISAVSTVLNAAVSHENGRICGMTSVKSLIGHTKAASGAAGFIKTVIALNQRIIPPLAGCDEPNEIFSTVGIHLYPVMQGEVLQPDTILRAAVSSMGFGGINCHITLESRGKPDLTLKPSIDERALLVSSQTSEVFFFCSETVEEVIAQVSRAILDSSGISDSELSDFSKFICSLIEGLNSWRFRCSIVATSPTDLINKLTLLKDFFMEYPSHIAVKDAAQKRFCPVKGIIIVIRDDQVALP